MPTPDPAASLTAQNCARPRAEIREATLADLDQLVAMAGHFLSSSLYGQLFGPVPAECLAFLVTRVLADGVAFVAELDGRLIGMIGVWTYPHPFSGNVCAEEVAWWVEPGARGRVGLELLDAAEAWSARHLASLLKVAVPIGIELGGLLERRDYAPVETVYIKRLEA